MLHGFKAGRGGPNHLFERDGQGRTHPGRGQFKEKTDFCHSAEICLSLLLLFELIMPNLPARIGISTKNARKTEYMMLPAVE